MEWKVLVALASNSRRAMFATLGACCLAGCAVPDHPESKAQPPRPSPAFDQPGAALDYFIAQRAPPGSDDVPVERYALARAHAAGMPSTGLNGSAAKLGARVWRQSGPDNVGGRTRELLFDPADPNVMYAAAVSGGVWKSTDAALSWRSTGDQLANLAVVSLAFEPGRRRIYAGTGEGLYVNRPASRSRGVRGDGIFISDDAGVTWSQLAATAGKTDFDFVNDLKFDAGGRLYAATRAGVFSSSDRGVSFTRALAVPTVEGCSDLAVAAAPATVLVSCGVHSPGGVWVSRDRGASWAQTLGDASTGRSSLAVAPSNSRIVYALSADPFDYGMRRVSQSSDGGLTWQTRVQRGSSNLASNLLLSNGPFSVNPACNQVVSFGGQGWFDNVIAVDPANPDVVWAGGIDLFRSDDGARTFRFASRWNAVPGQPGYVHADQHVIAFHPGYNGSSNAQLFVANDGGVQFTANARGGTNASPCGAGNFGFNWQVRNRGYFATQFYHGSATSDGSLLGGGAQDNGTHIGPPNLPSAWRQVFGGDGVFTLFDPRDARTAYLGSQFANLLRTDDGFANQTPIINGLNVDSRDFLFITPLTLDQRSPDTLYTGGRAIFRSRNRGDLWSSIGARGLDPADGIVSALSVAPDDSNRLAVGFNSGTIVVTDNALAQLPTWRVAQPRAGFVSGLTLAPGASGMFYATYSTFGGNKVLRSADAGVSWQPIDRAGEANGLPDVPAHDLLIDPLDPSRLLLGTDIGLFVGLDSGARWAADASGLGNVLIEKLVAVPNAGGYALHAFTYGRGAFSAELSALPRQKTNPGWTGVWFDPATDGQGFQFEVIPELDTLAVGWYTYLPSSSPRTRSDQLWITGAATLRDGAAEISVFRARGRFDAAGSGLQAVGTLRVSFIDCGRATARYDLNLDGTPLRGEIALQRLTPDAVCESFRTLGDGALSTLPRPADDAAFQYGVSGSWFNPATDGQGMLLEYLAQSRLLAASWYSYDFTDAASDGNQPPLWLTAAGPVDGNRATLTVTLSRGGAFNDGAAVARSTVGSLTIALAGCSVASAAYDLTIDGQRRSGQIPIQRVAAPALCRPALRQE